MMRGGGKELWGGREWAGEQGVDAVKDRAAQGVVWVVVEFG